MFRDLIASKFGFVVDRHWTNSSSDETAERWRFLNKVIAPELMSKCIVLSADIEAAYPSFPFQLTIEVSIVTLNETFHRATSRLCRALWAELNGKISKMDLSALKAFASRINHPESAVIATARFSEVVSVRQKILDFELTKLQNRVVIRISNMRHRQRKKRPSFILLSPGQLPSLHMKDGMLTITKTQLSSWVRYALYNQYLTCHGRVWQQARGFAQGKADAVRMSQLVLNFFDLCWTRKMCALYTASDMPDGIRLWILSSQRMVDDHWALSPKDFDWTKLLYFRDFADPNDHGIYPSKAVHLEGLSVVDCPFVFDTSNFGSKVNNLDFTSMIEDNKIHYKQFDKVEEIPQLRHLRKFPHKDTMLSKQVIQNTILNQINRADRRTSKLTYLLEAMRKDITSRFKN